jgi:hypothetical protein
LLYLQPVAGAMDSGEQRTGPLESAESLKLSSGTDSKLSRVALSGCIQKISQKIQ